MVIMSNRRFLPIACAAFAIVTLSAQPDAVDLLLINGKVFTADPAAPWAQAVVIHGDRISAVGSTAAIRARAAANAQVVDVGGRVVIPGINDAHTHVGTRPLGVSLKVNGNDPAPADVIAGPRGSLQRSG
jgi:hypothetical protein